MPHFAAAEIERDIHGVFIAELGVWIANVSSPVEETSSAQVRIHWVSLFIGLAFNFTLRFFDVLGLVIMRLFPGVNRCIELRPTNF